MNTEEEEQARIKMAAFTYENLMEFAKSWGDANHMNADMMQGILQMGINTYESTYAGYSIAMESYSNSEKEKETEKES